ncbi:MAG: glycosyltransferase [Candidatus Omnitrophica bacterium]|nr:glycosyltransferase [Candidatus Omnitrophota bacterium]
MENKQIFSIITVSYNQGRYIEETIKSVIFQEGDFFLEYLIVDGGSTDNTLEILQKYKELIENKKIEIKCKGIEFKYISEKDQGPTNALNKGLKMVMGSIIGIINSDDIYPEGALNQVWTTFQRNSEIDIVYGDIKFIDEEGNYIILKKGKPNLNIKDFIYENAIIQPEAFLRKGVFKNVGLFDEDLKFANDYEFWIRCLKNQIKFKYIPYTLAIFRKREDARSSSKNPFIFIDTLKVQYKYFGLTNFFLKNIGIYSAMFSYQTKKNCNSGFDEILKLLNKELSLNLSRKLIKKAKSFCYLKFSIYKIYEDKKESFKNYSKAIIYNPSIFFSKNNLIFLIRFMLVRKNIYFSIKSFFLKLKNL